MSNTRTPAELQAISTIERACSVFSLVGSLFVIITFCSFNGFQKKPVNRLVFYATFGNMMTNIGTLMSRSYVDQPDSVGCQFQSFLIQMFMPADAFWTLAMAVNVYLTFYHRFDAERLSKMEIPYLLCCFGVPFLPALIFVFIRDGQGQRVYGDATLWCWVSKEWNVLRIATFYAPVWVLILTTILIYLRAGGTIYQKRNQLQDATAVDSHPSNDIIENTKVTDITVTTQTTQVSTDGAERVTTQLQYLGLHGAYSTQQGYFVSISADGNTTSSRQSDVGDNVTIVRSRSRADGDFYRRRQRAELNRAAWSYTKCAILFFTALLITWIPSTANRFYSFINPGKSIKTLEFMSAFVLPLQGFWNAVIYATTSWTACKDAWARVGSLGGRVRGSTQRTGRTRQKSSGSGGHHRGFRLGSSPRRRNDGDEVDSESMTELASPQRAKTASRRNT